MDWIPIEEDVPKEEGNYPVIINNEVDFIDTISTAWWNGEDFTDIIGYPPVTHWLPVRIPEVPEK